MQKQPTPQAIQYYAEKVAIHEHVELTKCRTSESIEEMQWIERKKYKIHKNMSEWTKALKQIFHAHTHTHTYTETFNKQNIVHQRENMA